MRRLSFVAAIGGVVAALLGAVGMYLYVTTPAVKLEHRDPHTNQPHQAAASPDVINATLIRVLYPGSTQSSSPPANPPVARRGLWIEAPELSLALPLRQGDGSNRIPYYVALVYPGTSAPGAAGNSFIYAHGYIDMFGGLLYARNGDAVTLHNYATGQVQAFRVSRVVGRVRFDDVSWIHAVSQGPMLTLSTCVDTNLQGDRYIVQATPA